MVRYFGWMCTREFAQLAVAEDGLVRDEGRIGVTPEALRRWAAGLREDNQVALEATSNSDVIANLLAPLVGRVVVSKPSKTRAIAVATVKTDEVDARILAQPLAADFLPPVWLPVRLRWDGEIKMAKPQAEHCVVIVGGGFAGFNAARELSRRVDPATEIVLINSADDFVYLPLMPQVGGGLVEPRHICVSLPRLLLSKTADRVLRRRGARCAPVSGSPRPWRPTFSCQPANRYRPAR